MKLSKITSLTVLLLSSLTLIGCLSIKEKEALKEAERQRLIQE